MQNYTFNYAQYKKKINRKSISFIPILLVLIIILLGIAFCLTRNSQEQEFYFVQIDEFASYKDASILSYELQEKNAGGFIYYNGIYHVLANFYIQKKDAETVASNLKSDYPKSCVFSLSAPKQIQTTNLSSKQYAYANEFCLISLTAIQDLSELSIKYDSSLISFSELRVKIKDLSSKLKQSTDKIASELSPTNHNLAIKHAQIIADCLEDLKGTTEHDLSKQIKYELTKLVINYSSFLSSF